LTVPSLGAVTSVSIFMASSTSRVCPDFTSEPASTSTVTTVPATGDVKALAEVAGALVAVGVKV